MPERSGDYRGYGGGCCSEAVGVYQHKGLGYHDESEHRCCDVGAFVALNRP